MQKSGGIIDERKKENGGIKMEEARQKSKWGI